MRQAGVIAPFVLFGCAVAARGQEPCAAGSEQTVAGVLRNTTTHTSGAGDWRTAPAQVKTVLSQARGLGNLLRRFDFVARPVGMQVEISLDVGSPGPDAVATLPAQPSPLHVEAMFFSFVCDSGRVAPRWTDADRGRAIDVDTLSQTLGNTGQTINGKPAYRLDFDLGQCRGFRLFMPYTNDPRDTSRYSRSVLVTRPGQLPFRNVTRRELLDHWATQMESASQVEAERTARMVPIRPKEEQEAAVQRRIAEIKGYAISEPAVIQGETSASSHAVNTVDWDFANPTIGLSLNCYPRCTFGQYLVTLDERHFVQGLALTAPQYLVVNVAIRGRPESDHPHKRRLREETLAAFDLDALAAMRPR